MQLLCHYVLGWESGRRSVQVSFFIKLLLSLHNEGIKKPLSQIYYVKIVQRSWAAFQTREFHKTLPHKSYVELINADAFWRMIKQYCCTQLEADQWGNTPRTNGPCLIHIRVIQTTSVWVSVVGLGYTTLCSSGLTWSWWMCPYDHSVSD